MNIRRWREKMRYLPVIIVAGAGIILSGITFKVMRDDADKKIQRYCKSGYSCPLAP
jgi:hypothetical protein